MEEIIMEIGGLLFCRTKPVELDKVLEIEKDNSNFVFTWSRERHLEAIEREDELHVSIKLAEGRKLIGYIILAGIGGEDKVLEFRRMAISEKGRGYGRISLGFIKKYCFEILKYHRLWLDAYTDNQRAIELYRKEGFIQEGLIRECKKGKDAYRSMVIMSMLEGEYRR
ncbi:MAG: GNAT family N-acetyltransferase [Caulobacteraceae bacterium]